MTGKNIPILSRPQFSEDKMPEVGQTGSSWLGSKLPEIPGEQYFKLWHFKEMSISLSSPSPPLSSPYIHSFQILITWMLWSHSIDFKALLPRTELSSHRNRALKEKKRQTAEFTQPWNTEQQERTREGGNSSLMSEPALPTPAIKSPAFPQGVRDGPELWVQSWDPWSGCA